jgi:acyl-CoA thioesterase FadM
MNLWLRLIWMLLTAHFRRPVQLFETSRLRLRVLPNDLDFNGHVNNGRYFTLADLGRLDFVIRTGAARVAIANGAFPLIGDAVAKFRKDLKLFQSYELQSRLMGWDNKWTYMEHRFVRAGRVAGVVIIRGQFRSAGGPLSPRTILTGLGLAQQTASPSLPDWALAWQRSCEALGDALREEERHRVDVDAAVQVGRLQHSDCPF